MVIYWQLFLSVLKIGIFGYGGGPSMIPLLEKEVVDVHHWLSQAEFVDALAMGNSLPGPIIVKMCGYIGLKVAGWPGAAIGAIGVFLPSMIAMIILAKLFFAYKDLPQVQATFKAVRPAIVALVFIVVVDIFPSSVKSWHTGLIAVVTFVVIYFLNLHPALAILGAAIFGILVY